MSYCRQGPESDLYCYMSFGAVFHTHVGHAGLIHDGEQFVDKGLERFAARVKLLHDIGYDVPNHTFQRISEEMQKRKDKTK